VGYIPRQKRVLTSVLYVEIGIETDIFLTDSKERENRNSLRSDVSKLLLKALHTRTTIHVGEATGLKSILMAYEKYETMIICQHHIKIQGWPAEIPFNVAKISVSPDLRHIQQGLEQGTICWVRLTREEVKKLDETYLEDRPKMQKKQKPKSQPSKKDAKKRMDNKKCNRKSTSAE
jgi:hypothetical protein